MSFEFGDFSLSISKLCPIQVFGFRRNKNLSVEFWMPLYETPQSGVFEELETGPFRNHIVADAVIRNPTAFLNLFAPPISVLQM